MVFVIPPKSQVGVLAPEIAGEGERVIYSDGEVVNFIPPPAKPVVPDWSGIKSIRKYFGPYVHRTYPAWLYHPTEAPRLVKNADEAAELGVGYRDATIDERGRYGVKAVWDWTEDSKWRPEPWPGTMKFDPLKPTHGKTYIPGPVNPIIAQNALLEALVPLVTAAVIGAVQKGGAPAAPSHIDPKDWADFLEFQAFRKSAEAVGAAKRDLEDAPIEIGDGGPEIATNALTGALTPVGERMLWEAEAARKGITVDRRWGLERLKAEVEKAA